VKISTNESTPVTGSGRSSPAPAEALLICSDLLDLCDEARLTASRGCRSLHEAVREAERRRRQREALALLL
jgi:hypothetical protein